MCNRDRAIAVLVNSCSSGGFARNLYLAADSFDDESSVEKSWSQTRKVNFMKVGAARTDEPVQVAPNFEKENYFTNDRQIRIRQSASAIETS